MIDTEALRKKVIDLAIQGKLTEQLPSDGDAETLYAQILDQKSQLIKEGKIKKDKVLPDIAADEIPFEVPDNWKWVRLISVCETIADIDHKMPVSQESGIPLLSAKDINDDNSLNFDNDIKYISEEDFERLRKKIQPQIEDIIFSRIGTLGKVGYVDIDKEFLVSYSCVVIRKIGIIKEYLGYCLQGSEMQRRVHSAKTGIGVPDLGMEMIKRFIIPLSPLKEQKRIIEKLEEIIKQIDIIENLQAKYINDLAVLKSKIIDAGIQGKLTEQLPEDGDAEDLYAQILNQKSQLIKEGKIKKEKPLPDIAVDEIPFEIPKNWKWVRWGDLSEKIQYGYNAPAKQSGRIRMVRISDIQDSKVQWETVPFCDIDEEDIDAYLLRENDILFARTGGTVGKSYIVSEIPEEAVFAGYLIRTSYSSDIYAPYMKYFMESALYWKQLQSGTVATAQPNCNGKTLSKMIVPFPPYTEQKRIAEKIKAILEQINW